MNTSTDFYPFEFNQNGYLDISHLQAKAPKPPRYLIRVHTARSQGLMTKDSFLSAAELFALENNVHLLSLRDYEPALFERHVHNHLTNFKGNAVTQFLSPFISLTVSLRTALAWAKMRSMWHHTGIKIAVLDTTTVGSFNCDCEHVCDNPFHHNPIWPANMLYKACGGKTKEYPDEFVAFGHVRGIFKSCTFAELETTIFSQYLPELSCLPRSQRYEELPETLATFWRKEQPLHPSEKDLVIHISRQLSNDNLLIPMVAFVLCVRRRSLNDRQVLDTVVRAARLIEKQSMYDFLGYFHAFPVIDFFSRKQGQQIETADSVELVQTTAILEKVKLCFAEVQEKEARQMWDCTTVVLVCKAYCPLQISDSIAKSSLRTRRSLKNDLDRAFARLQAAVFRSKLSGLRLLKNELANVSRGYDIHSGTIAHVKIKKENEHEFWTRAFGEIATKIDSLEHSTQAPDPSFNRPIARNERSPRPVAAVDPKIHHQHGVSSLPNEQAAIGSTVLRSLKSITNQTSTIQPKETLIFDKVQPVVGGAEPVYEQPKEKAMKENIATP